MIGKSPSQTARSFINYLAGGRIRPRRRIFTSTIPLIAVAILGLWSSNVAAAEPHVYMVEEDWELVVGEPKPAIHSPQLSFYLFPDAASPGVYFRLQLNHAARQDFAGGGFMVTAVVNEVAHDEAKSDFRTPLTYDGERLKWTSAMAVMNGELLYAIKDGLGSHWGSFGGPDYILRMPAGAVRSLDGYSPQESVKSLEIGFGSNRVKTLVLKKARLHYSNQEVVEVVLNASANGAF
jgi:hypothetical protein